MKVKIRLFVFLTTLLYVQLHGYSQVIIEGIYQPEKIYPTVNFNLLLYCYDPFESMKYLDIPVNILSNEVSLTTYGLKRAFDPRSIERYSLNYFSFKNINNHTRILFDFTLGYELQFQKYSSLERNFYQNYQSFMDTTTGNFRYIYPELSFLYWRELTKRFSYGIRLNYRLEHGIKDRYTGCESFETYFFPELYSVFSLEKLELGGSIEFERGFSSYEAVKYYSDAVNGIYLGYNVYGYYYPGAKNVKREQRRGDTINLFVKLRESNKESWWIKIGFKGRLKSEKTELETYSYRDFDLFNKGVEIFMHSFYGGETSPLRMYFQVSRYSEKELLINRWYEKIVLKNNSVSTRFSAHIFYNTSIDDLIGAFFYLDSRKIDYLEYLSHFSFKRHLLSGKLGLFYKKNLNRRYYHSVRLSGGSTEPNFYWSTKRIQYYQIDFRVGFFWDLYRIEFKLFSNIYSSNDNRGNIQQRGLMISVIN